MESATLVAEAGAVAVALVYSSAARRATSDGATDWSYSALAAWLSKPLESVISACRHAAL